MDLDVVYAARLTRMRSDLLTLTERVDRIERTLISMRLSPRSSPDQRRSPQPVDRSSPPHRTLGMRLDQALSPRVWVALGSQALRSVIEKAMTWGIGLATPTLIIYGKQAWGWVSPSLQVLRSWLGL